MVRLSCELLRRWMRDSEQIATSLASSYTSQVCVSLSAWMDGQPLSMGSWRLTAVLRKLVARDSSSVLLSCERCVSCTIDVNDV